MAACVMRPIGSSFAGFFPRAMAFDSIMEMLSSMAVAILSEMLHTSFLYS